VGIYILVVIIVMMLAGIVVTQEPNEDPELTKTARKSKGTGYVSPGPRQSLVTTAGTLQK
jgi:hypothetical protein